MDIQREGQIDREREEYKSLVGRSVGIGTIGSVWYAGKCVQRASRHKCNLIWIIRFKNREMAYTENEN